MVVLGTRGRFRRPRWSCTLTTRASNGGHRVYYGESGLLRRLADGAKSPGHGVSSSLGLFCVESRRFSCRDPSSYLFCSSLKREYLLVLVRRFQHPSGFREVIRPVRLDRDGRGGWDVITSSSARATVEENPSLARLPPRRHRNRPVNGTLVLIHVHALVIDFTRDSNVILVRMVVSRCFRYDAVDIISRVRIQFAEDRARIRRGGASISTCPQSCCSRQD